MTTAYINRVATAVPPHDIHEAFRGFAQAQFRDNRHTSLFQRMADRSGIGAGAEAAIALPRFTAGHGRRRKVLRRLLAAAGGERERGDGG